jgi:hypothetical protein
MYPGRLNLLKWVPGISSGVKAAGAEGWRPTILIVRNVKKIRGINLPATPWATSARCGRPLPFTLCLGCGILNICKIQWCTWFCLPYHLACTPSRSTNTAAICFITASATECVIGHTIFTSSLILSNVLLKDVVSFLELDFIRKKPIYWIKLVYKILPFVWMDGENHVMREGSFIQSIIG